MYIWDSESNCPFDAKEDQLVVTLPCGTQIIALEWSRVHAVAVSGRNEKAVATAWHKWVNSMLEETDKETNYSDWDRVYHANDHGVSAFHKFSDWLSKQETYNI